MSTGGCFSTVESVPCRGEQQCVQEAVSVRSNQSHAEENSSVYRRLFQYSRISPRREEQFATGGYFSRVGSVPEKNSSLQQVAISVGSDQSQKRTAVCNR